jgi:hypothetical protein
MEQQIVKAGGVRYDLNVMEDGTDKRMLSLIGTSRTIREIGRGPEAIILAAKVFLECAKTIGVKTGTADEWKQTQNMMFNALHEDYAGVTWEEVREAFRMVVSSKLDAYLPRDAEGNAKRECIGRFKVMYFCRVMDAYVRRKSDAQRKYYEKQQEAERERDRIKSMNPTSEQDDAHKRIVRAVFDRWKSTGRSLNLQGREDIIVYGWLTRHGLIKDEEVTADDKKEAYNQFMEHEEEWKRRNPYQTASVKKDGWQSYYLLDDARLMMMRRVLQAAFLEFEKRGW